MFPILFMAFIMSFNDAIYCNTVGSISLGILMVENCNGKSE